MIRIADTYTHPVLKPLFDVLRRGVTIRRSNGDLDPGWKILDDPFHTPNLIRRQPNGSWYATFERLDSTLTKGVCLNTIFDTTHPEQLAILNTAIPAMDDGIYKAYAEEQNRAPRLS